ncbi:MAG: NUDIX domain-containing protein [Sphingobacteriales bacterium]|nr:MAG: NUDIX domain-containing protein [Sphingobacteriales bacterium]
MPKQSAGILLYKMVDNNPLVFLVHPGGPLWKNKDTGAWSVPKGEFVAGEDTLDAAKREFEEETGKPIHGVFTPLEPVKQRSGKMVYAWAVEGDIDSNTIVSNTFDFEWPPRSGRTITIPEVDRGEWFDPATAKEKINPGQVPLIDNLLQILAGKN